MQHFCSTTPNCLAWAWITRRLRAGCAHQADFERDLLRYAAKRGLDAAASN
jgi:hypothetical protein